MGNSIIPVLLAGGAGKRLWPLSRASYPKQFVNLIGEYSLLQQTALRLISSNKIKFSQPLVLTDSDFRFVVTEQLMSIGVDPDAVLIEPCSRNTAPAILAASLYSYDKDEDSTLIVAPSDHVIEDTPAFHDAILRGLDKVNRGKIVTFGINPTHAETGYGYIEIAQVPSLEAIDLVRFVEKPNTGQAQSMLKQGNFLWNAGIFLFKARDMIEAFNNLAPTLLAEVKTAISDGEVDLGFFRFDPDSWGRCDDISIDFAVMEKSNNLAVVPFRENWTDLGTWNAVWKHMVPDENGVSLSSLAHALDCKDTLLRSESSSQVVVGLGLDNIMVVAMPDAVLVADKNRTQDIKQVVEQLKSEKIPQAEVLPKDFRPWGWYDVLTCSDGFKVKRITVHPGASLSLQSHQHRSEHWVIVEGVAKVTIAEDVKLVPVGASVYIPLGATHRIENTGKVPMVFIEVQVGVYLGEDDIVRYDDIYSRA